MPILQDHSLEFISRSVEQTRRLGMRLGALLQTGDVVCLAGDLGSGKTTLVQGISTGWGSLDQASSPSFVLVNVYRHPEGKYLYHLDAYRLNSAKEAEEIDIDLFIEAGPLVIEWADRIKNALPNENLWINFYYVNSDQRDMVISTRGSHYQWLLNRLRMQIYGAV